MPAVLDLGRFARILADLFGERMTTRIIEAFMKRSDKRAEGRQSFFEKGTGAIVSSPAVAAPAVARSASAVPAHNFHCESGDEDE